MRLFVIFTACVVLTGCVQVKRLNERVTQQEQIIAKLREDNAQFQKNYYQIKEILDSESADKEKKVAGLQRELDKSQNLKSQKERELGDELNLVKLQSKAFREETAEQQKAAEAAAERLRQTINEVTAERDAAMKKLGELDAQYRAQSQRLAEITKETADLRVNLKAAQDQAANLNKELEATRQALAAEKSARAGAEQQLQAARQSQAETEKKLDKATTDLQSARAEASKAKTDLDKAAAEHKKVAAQLADKSKSQPKAPLAASDDPALKAAAEKIRQRLAGLEGAKGADVRLDTKGLRIILPSDNLFQSKSVILADRANPVLDRVGETLATLSGRPIKIEGHTDSDPVKDLPFADNWGLGFARADRVRDYLMQSTKLNAKNVSALSRADLDPIGNTAAANRRVEIVVGN
ncbi:MAG: hypothetical protein ABFD69_11330 [Candidatus Sumerlaeia bacterium]